MNMDLEKLRDKTAEACILSSSMNDYNLLAKVSNQVKEYYFDYNIHKYIWRAMMSLYQDNKPIDIVSIRHWLRTETDYPDENITEKLNAINDLVIAPVYSELKEHINIVLSHYKTRRMVLMAKKLIHEAGKGTDYKKIKTLLTENNLVPIESLSNIEGTDRPETGTNIIDNANRESEKAIEEGSERIRGISTGLNSLDKYLSLRPKNTYIIAARPSMGKTSLALSQSYNLAKKGYKIGWISIEMDKESMIEKMISINNRISNRNFRKQHESKKIKMRNNLKKAFSGKLDNIIIVDTASDLDEIVNAIYTMYKTHNIDLFIIDYLQLCYINGFDGSRNNEIERISRKFKVVSTKLMIPGIVLSQLNRSVEQRSNKRPTLSDLRNSGAIEQDATAVISIYRAEEYGITQDAKGRGTKFKAELGIMKNRFGEKGMIRTNFIKDYAFFTDSDNEIEECKIREGYYE